SGGGAGVQMDIRVMQRLGVFATTAITAVTAQNLEGVDDVEAVGARSVAAQIETVLSGFPVAAVKTGMLWSAASVRVVADALARTGLPLVVDPVMVATTGARLVDDAAIEAYGDLWPLATLVTPNLDEAAVLLGTRPAADRLRDAAEALAAKLRCAVLLKGGHLEGAPRDVLATEGQTVHWDHPRIAGAHSHGSGCMLSSAIAARLAHGDPLADACERAIAFTHDALAKGASTGHAGLAAVELARSDLSHLRPARAVP
ncbi:MAG: bifunctional hydroxymethylpyrimidine kinase/phosphomethylpyrimidine kinase, partial [Myxococcota bacterium]